MFEGGKLSSLEISDILLLLRPEFEKKSGVKFQQSQKTQICKKQKRSEFETLTFF